MLKKKKIITYFVVRVGGWDGIALQTELWLKIYLGLGYEVHLVTGEIDTSPGSIDTYPYNQVRITCIPGLHLEHQGELFQMAQKAEYSRAKWVKEFVKDKDILKQQLLPIVKESQSVFLHNFSIKHLIPSAWAAMMEIVKENPRKKFVGLDADSPYERPQIVEDLSPDVIHILGDMNAWYGKTEKEIRYELKEFTKTHSPVLPGADLFENLDHIVLNSYQQRIAKNIYAVPANQITALPDLGSFKGNFGITDKEIQNQVIAYLQAHQQTWPQELNTKDYVYIISPVRPIQRKKLREVAYMAKLFEKYLEKKRKKKKVVLVVTHPNVDEKRYFNQLVRYCKDIELTFIHVGSTLKLRKDEGQECITYHDLMAGLQNSHSVSIVASEFGGWENGILESTEFKIPVSANPYLPSFQDMNAYGYKYIAAPILVFSDLRQTKFSDEYLSFPSIQSYYHELFKVIFDSKERAKNVEHNFNIGKRVQSVAVATKLIKKILTK